MRITSTVTEHNALKRAAAALTGYRSTLVTGFTRSVLADFEINPVRLYKPKRFADANQFRTQIPLL